jgi:signal transduction histidine kinase/ActR/RegA family two-component response regulator
MSAAHANRIGPAEMPDPERVLIVAPTGRDAAVIVDALASAGMSSHAYIFPALLLELKGQTMGALIVAEEALLDGNAERLAQALRGQPSWSDIPLIVLLSQRRPGGADPALPAGLGVDGLALLLERPLRKTSLMSTVRMVLRARRRQYEVRDHINAQVRIGLELAHASRSKDEFLAMLAHELRNPLAPIRNAGTLLQRLATNDPNIRQLSEMIDRQSSHMTRLLDSLLDVSRITRGKITLESRSIDAEAIAIDAVETARPLMELREHHLHLILPTSPLKFNGDATRLTQVLGNLLINSAKYTPVGGKITLALESTVEHIVFRVRDNGIGIEPEMMPHIFELFSQAETTLDRSNGGLGIGLAVVKGIVELHKGSVSACSDGCGRGAEFVVRLPRAVDTTVNEHAARRHAPLASPQRIMIADDNADLAESMAMLLGLEGHEVRVAHDGPAALELADAFQPNAAVLDIGLPSLSGYELARELRSRQHGDGLLLIAATGYGQPEDRARAKGAGFDLHMVKPVDPQIVAAEIARWANNRSRRR